MATKTTEATKTKRPAEKPADESAAAGIPANVRLGRRGISLGRRQIKPRQITEEMEPYIERRLELRNGTTPTEVGADLCNRFGIPWARDGEAAQNRREGIAGLVAGFREWLALEYGDEIRDGMNVLIGHGDRIVVERGHYKKIW